MVVAALTGLLVPAPRAPSLRSACAAPMSLRSACAATMCAAESTIDVSEAAAAIKEQLPQHSAPQPPPQDEPRALDARLFALNTLIIDVVKGAIDQVYLGRDIPRFFVLETVARVPYFAYLSVMHLRETFGERDAGFRQRMRVHYAEADNELHHLLIMEALGGNASAVDRGVAQTMAFGYYWYVVLVYALSPSAAYHLSELIEDHAYHTYDEYLRRCGDELRAAPVPQIARDYYEAAEPFLFDLVSETCRPRLGDGGLVSETCRTDGARADDDADDADAADAADAAGAQVGAAGCCPRRPELRSLYDVFVCVRNDEKEHWEALATLVQRGELGAGGTPVCATRPAALPAPADTGGSSHDAGTLALPLASAALVVAACALVS